MPEHNVKQGDCILSIAYEYGVEWKKIWDHPENEALKNLRKDPNVLFPGDKVFVPEREKFTVRTGKRHVFRKKEIKGIYQIKIVIEGDPQRNKPFEVEIDGKRKITGTTDGEGFAKFPIPAKASHGVIAVSLDEDELECQVSFGTIDPSDEISGIQQRLNNLDFSCGPADGELGPRTSAAIARFQKACGLDESGQLDENTRSKIVEKHGG